MIFTKNYKSHIKQKNNYSKKLKCKSTKDKNIEKKMYEKTWLESTKSK